MQTITWLELSVIVCTGTTLPKPIEPSSLLRLAYSPPHFEGARAMYLRTLPFGSHHRVAASVTILTLAALSLTALATTLPHGELPVTAPPLDLSRLPLNFEPNVGQALAPAQYVAHTPLGTLHFSPSGVVFSL